MNYRDHLNHLFGLPIHSPCVVSMHVRSSHLTQLLSSFYFVEQIDHQQMEKMNLTMLIDKTDIRRVETPL